MEPFRTWPTALLVELEVREPDPAEVRTTLLCAEEVAAAMLRATSRAAAVCRLPALLPPERGPGPPPKLFRGTLIARPPAAAPAITAPQREEPLVRVDSVFWPPLTRVASCAPATTLVALLLLRRSPLDRGADTARPLALPPLATTTTGPVEPDMPCCSDCRPLPAATMAPEPEVPREPPVEDVVWRGIA